jgi:outer membrane protein assembly factor BamA
VVASRGARLGTPTILTERFVEAKLNEDVQQLIAYYRRLGYLDAQVAYDVQPTGDLSAVNVTFHVREGRMYAVRSIRMDGNQALPQDRLMKGVALQAGKPYDESVVRQDVQRVTQIYGYEGRQVGVEPGVFLVDGQPGVVDVVYRVMEPERVAQQRPGPGGGPVGPAGPRGPDRVGKIEIVGNSVTRDRVILNQLTGLNPGQILEYPRVEEARQNLIRLQIFDNDPPPIIDVLPPDNPDSPFRDLRVTVRETRTGMVGLQFGVNSNAGVNGTLAVNQRNFDLFKFPTSWDDLFGGRAFRGGGQELRLQAMPGTVFQRYEVTWREPFLFDQPYGLTTSFYYSGRGFFEYNENRYGGRVTVDRRLDEYGVWHANFSTRVEGVNLYGVPDFAPNSIKKDAGNGFLLGLRGGITRDTRDSFLMPTTGSLLDFNVEQVLGTNQFPIGTVEGTKFWTLHQARDGGWKGVLALRSQLSVMADNAPVYERIYGGGFRSLRGFTFRGVGPYEAAPGQPALNVGGSFAFLNTVEYQIPLMASELVRFVTFVDHGTIERNVALRDYRVSAGIGLRIQVPAFGPLPIALDFAWPIRKGRFDNEQIFSFYVGWIGGQ